MAAFAHELCVHVHGTQLEGVHVCMCVCCPADTGATKPMRDVKELVKGMNIQFDNLCQVRDHSSHRLSAMLGAGCAALRFRWPELLISCVCAEALPFAHSSPAACCTPHRPACRPLP